MLRDKSNQSILEICQRLQSRGYELSTSRIQLGSLAITLATPTNIETAWDRIASSGGQPYWAQLWPAAEALATALYTANCAAIYTPRETQVGGRKVLDFACGLGVTGIVARAVGRDVDFADISGDALLFAQLNCELNAPANRNSRCAFRKFDWQVDRWETKYDCILAADVLYDPACWQDVSDFWQDQLAVGGQVLVSEPGRGVCESIAPWFEGNGWQCRAMPLENVSPMRMFVLSREGS